MIDSTNLSTPSGPTDGTPASPGGRRTLSGCGCILGVIVPMVILASISGFIFAMFPASQKLAKPIVCPDAVEMVITTSVSRNMEGESTMRSKAYCVDEEERAWPVPGGKIFAVHMGGTFLVLFGVIGMLRLATHRPKPYRPGVRQ